MIYIYTYPCPSTKNSWTLPGDDAKAHVARCSGGHSGHSVGPGYRACPWILCLLNMVIWLVVWLPFFYFPIYWE